MESAQEKDGCMDEGVSRKLGEVWSDPGVCNLKECKSGGFVDIKVCHQLEIPDGCWVVQGDLTQDYPLCCPRTECPDESSSSSSSSSEDSDPDKYEDLEEDGDEGGDEFAFANLESFGQNTTDTKENIDTLSKKSSANKFSDILNDAEKYIQTLNIKRELRAKALMKEEETNKRFNEVNETSNRVYKSANKIEKNEIALTLNNEEPQLTHDKEVKLTDVYPNETEVHLKEDIYENKHNYSQNQPMDEHVIEDHSAEDTLKGEYEELKVAIDTLQEDMKICGQEGKAPLPPEVHEAIQQVEYSSRHYSEEFIKSMGPDEEFENSLASITKQVNEFESREIEFEEPESMPKLLEFNDPYDPIIHGGDEEFIEALDDVTRQAKELMKMQKETVHTDCLDHQTAEKEWYEPLFEAEYIMNHEQTTDIKENNTLSRGYTADFPKNMETENHQDATGINENISDQSVIDELRFSENNIEQLNENVDLQTQDYDGQTRFDYEYTSVTNSQELQADLSSCEGMAQSDDGPGDNVHAINATESQNVSSIYTELPDEHLENVSQPDADGSVTEDREPQVDELDLWV